MKKYLLLLFLMVGLLPMSSSAQGPVYYSISYIKINPGKAETYFNLIKNYSPKITEARIRMGGVLGWYMYEVRMPSGAANEYDLVSVTVTNDFRLLFDDLAPSDDTMKKILPGATEKTINDIFAQYENSRTLVRKDIVVLTSGQTGLLPGAKYAWVDYVKVNDGKESEFANLLKAKNVRVYKKTMPIDAKREYTSITTLSSDDITTFGEGGKVISTTSEAERLKSISKISHSELWQLTSYVDESVIKK